MAIDVRDGLQQLAEREQPSAPPPDLWTRGVRRSRLRRAGAAGLAVVVLAAGGAVGAVVSDVVRTEQQPVSGDDPGAIPDRLESPNPWLPGTEHEGPLGPVAVIAGGERKAGLLGRSSNGIFGVSATTGEYRFLDLPYRFEESGLGMVSVDEPPVLSPDGRQVAYWGGEANGPAPSGIRVYDLETGDFEIEELPAEMGAHPRVLTWVSDDHLVYSYGVITKMRETPDGGSMDTELSPSVLWSPETGVQQEFDGSIDATFAPTTDGFASHRGRRLTLWSLGDTGEATPRQTSTHNLDVREVHTWQVSPASARIALVTPETRRGAGTLRVGPIPQQSGEVTTAAVDGIAPGFRASAVVGWRDDTHVMVEGYLAGERADSWGVYVVDVATGESDLAVSERQQNWSPGHTFASGLWAQDTVSRPGPENILDPRLAAAGGGVAALVLVAGTVILVRRRRAIG